MTRARVSLYRGYSTLNGRTIRRLYDVDLVKQDLLNHFNTRKNTRVRNAKYGSSIFDLLFELKKSPDQDSVNYEFLVREIARVVRTDSRVILQDIQIDNEEYGYIVSCDLFYPDFDFRDLLKIRFDLENFGAVIVNEENT